MSEVKRFSANYIPGHPPAIVTDPNGLLCLYGELDLERVAHAETKLAYDVLGDEFNEMESDLKDEIKGLKKRLKELEDANQKLRELYYLERKNLAQFREYADTYYPDLWDCFENSRKGK